MKRFTLTLIILFGMSVLVTGQNLVPNPSLEITSPCPSSGGQINYAASWSASLNSPDYFHSCGSGNYITPGPNLGGTQTPADGGAYAAMVVRHSSAVYREHMTAILNSPIVSGQNYTCIMKVSLTDISQYAANKIGFLFTNSPGGPVSNFAHVFTNNIITDKNGWVTVSGSFTATANYSYVTIGNFYDDANTSITSVTGGWYAGAYYYVDSISVVPSAVLPASQVRLEMLEIRDGRVLLGWDAQEDNDISTFELERSLDGGASFDILTGMDAEKDKLVYRYADAPGRYHVPILYRVRSFDSNGNTHLSNTVEALLEPGGNMSPDLYPNPVRRGESMTLRFQPVSDQDHQATLTDLPGRLLGEYNIPAAGALDGIQIETGNLSAGTYLIRIKSGNISETRKFTVLD